MFLSIDAGNSNIVFGFFDRTISKWSHELRVETKRNLIPLELVKIVKLFFLEQNLDPERIKQIGLSSVVPEVSKTLVDFCNIFFRIPPYTIQGESYHALKVSTARPDEIGTDLMANITASYERYRSSCIIVDFGTALTFSVVDDAGAVIGVSIVPGLKTAVKSLFAHTSKLPEVELRMPDSAIGKDTVHAIQAGILYGYTGLVEGMLHSIKKELGKDCKVMATGGLAEILTPLKNSFDCVDRNLTLDGIKLITEANVPTGGR